VRKGYIAEQFLEVDAVPQLVVGLLVVLVELQVLIVALLHVINDLLSLLFGLTDHEVLLLLLLGLLFYVAMSHYFGVQSWFASF
jgi:hypothetical protein